MQQPLSLTSISPQLRRRFLERGASVLAEIIPRVVPIINDVARRGDFALVEYTARFDQVDLKQGELLASEEETRESYRVVGPALLDSLRLMHRRVSSFHSQQHRQLLAASNRQADSLTIGQKHVPVERVAVYAPGGKARYPSTVIMGCTPARIAGVQEVIVCSPPSQNGRVAPEILVAADIAGASAVLKAGGAQAIAACALGTDTVAPVDMIVGPGNIYVTAAKTYLASIGQVGIDCPAGPSEVLIIADESAPARYIAWDMIAQAEHDDSAWSILVTTSARLASEVYEIIRTEIPSVARKDIVKASLERNGFILIAASMEQAFSFANEFAPEHLEIIAEHPEQLLDDVLNAGSVFLGPFSPVAVGDYLSGTNHILPTGGSARFTSGLGVSTFLRSITYQQLTQKSLGELEKPLLEMATAEGLLAHGKSVAVRGNQVSR